MRSVRFAPWAHLSSLVLLFIVVESNAATTGEQIGDEVMPGTLRRPDLLALLGASGLPMRRFSDDGAERNATIVHPNTRQLAIRETRRERQIVNPPRWYPYQSGQELRMQLMNSRQPPEQSPEQQTDGVRQVNFYPSCEASYFGKDFQSNGKQLFHLFFPQIARMRSGAQILVAKSTTLYLRVKSPGSWRLQKATTPSSSQASGATPNDVDTENISLNVDSADQTRVIVNITEIGCDSVLCRTSALVDLSASYPYAKISLRFFGLMWFTRNDDKVPRLEVTATDPVTKKRLNIGDLFVGVHCGTSEPKLSLPSYLTNDPSKLEYLEGLADSFLSIDYTARSSISSSTDRAIISRTGFNLRDFKQPKSETRPRLASRQLHSHRRHRGHYSHPGHHNGRGDWPTIYDIASNSDTAEATLTPTSAPELRDSRLRCDKQREFLTFAAAGMPTVVEPSGFTFVSCKCTKVCPAGSDSCMPCESRVLASQTLTVKELVRGEVVTRQRTIPTDCGCY